MLRSANRPLESPGHRDAAVKESGEWQGIMLREMREKGVMMREKLEEGEKYKQSKLVILV
jgi:hypothetical protein